MPSEPSTPLNAETDFPGVGARTWRPPAAIIIGLLILAGAAAVGAGWPREPLDRLVAGVVALVLLVVAVLGWRRRLVGGPRGLLIGSRIIPWSMVRTVGCGRTKRMGAATLEIDLVDDELIVFGRYELGSDPAEVADALQAWFEP
ncbi:MAG TPA: PH domain-containing protein, partial [Nakamurella sp.]